MPELKTKRPYQERFLDNFDRSQLRREVEAVPPRRMKGLRKKYATWALGASLAIGGIGAPLKMVQNDVPAGRAGGARTGSATAGLDSELASGFVAAMAEAPKKLTIVTEQVREDFFKKEVPFGAVIYQEAKKNNIRPELVAAVVQAESRFKPTARSGAGAIGLMQLVPRTGRWMGARDLTNPVQNIAAGTKYLKYLHERFDGNETKMIAAYNAGEGNVKRFGGVPPFKETRKYLTKVRGYEQEYKNRVDNRIADNDADQADAVPQVASMEYAR